MDAFDLITLTAVAFAGIRLWRGTGSPTTRGLMIASLLGIAWLII